ALCRATNQRLRDRGTGIWFPHLYFFPYAAMIIAIAPLGPGRHAESTRRRQRLPDQRARFLHSDAGPDLIVAVDARRRHRPPPMSPPRLPDAAISGWSAASVPVLRGSRL
ncbi:hypothetical protein, partial [Massilia phosphatilytica]